MAALADSIFLYSMSCLALLVCTMLFIVKSFSGQLVNSGTKHRPPPSPPALPIIGHLHLVGSVIPKCFQNLARLYGPLMQLRLGASTTLIVSNAQVAGEVLKTHDLNFCYRPEFGSSDYFPYKGSYFITAPYGPYWRFMKKLCVTQLLSTSQLGRFTHIRDQEIKSLLDSLLQCSREAKACDLSLEFSALTNNILCRMAMSTTCNADHIHGLVRECLELGAKLSLGEVLGPLGKLDLFGYGKKLAKVIAEFDQMLEMIMKEHEEKLSSHKSSEVEERKDMMDILLQIHRDPNAEVRLKRNDLKVFFLEILLAGTDTTSVALQWTMAEIINHPRVLNKLREEMDSIVGTSRLVKESDVPNLPYLQAVVKEVLRLHPSAPFALRQCAEDCNINGYDLKGQTRTLINVYAIMRDPQEWVSPEEFMPERFLDGSQNLIEMKSQDLIRYIPFGSGRRGCPGASLALTVIQSTIAKLIQCFDWKVKGGTKVDTEEGSGFSMGLAKPLVCCPITRLDLFSV